MSLQRLIDQRVAVGKPVRVGLIGAGKFGSMFLSQAPTTRGLAVSMICDLDVARARDACRAVGWSEAYLDSVSFTDDAAALCASDEVDVVVEATGNPVLGVNHALASFAAGKHVVMVNVEADVLVGPRLAREAAHQGVVYTMAYGDQPALTCELIDWARSSGFDVVAAGKGTKYLPEYHASTPDTVWSYYGLSAEQAAHAGMNSQMFNSFLDGTKSGIEMAAIANAANLTPSATGLGFPPCGTDDLARVLRPRHAGGLLEHSGQVEVVSSLERDGRPVYKDLRWGVYVVIEAPTDYAAACFSQYGLITDDSGRFAAMYKPFHLIGLELNLSIFNAALRGEAIGCSDAFNADVVATAKRNLKPGETLDGEGGYTVWGKLATARDSVAMDAVPIGLAHGLTLQREVTEGQTVCWQDVSASEQSQALNLRREMEASIRETIDERELA